MGTTSKAIHGYGVILGGIDGEDWTDNEGEIVHPLLGDSPWEWVHEKLSGEAPALFVEEEGPARDAWDAWMDRVLAVERNAPVELESIGSLDGPFTTVLLAKDSIVRAEWSEVKTTTRPFTDRITAQWADQVRNFLASVGLPVQKPEWLLGAVYG
jgi:hypothetical protein